MWMPLALPFDHPQRPTVAPLLAAHPYRQLICHGQLDGGLLDASGIRALQESPQLYGGSRHGQPMAPFCTFAAADDLGIARIERLVDHAAVTVDDWLTSACGALIAAYLRDHPAIQHLTVPNVVQPALCDVLVLRKMDGHYYVYRPESRPGLPGSANGSTWSSGRRA